MRLLLFLPIASIALLVGCIDLFSSEQATLEKYQQRLANVLDVKAIEITPKAAITMPPRRELFQPLPRLSLGLLESFQLRQCGLFSLLANKNSQLGKVQDAFHDLDYQTKLLKTLNHCLTNFDLSRDERTKLEHLYAQKWKHFHAHLDNLLLTSHAMQKQLTASDWLSVDSKNQVAQVVEALSLLIDIYAVPNKATSRLPNVSVVQYQEVIEKSRVIGRLYYSLKNTSLWLIQITELLESTQNKVICGKNRDTTRFRYLNNVFQTIYVGEVQPYLAYLDSTYQDLSKATQLVEERMVAQDQHYGLIEVHSIFRQATLDHVRFWQGLFKRCGVSVTPTL